MSDKIEALKAERAKLLDANARATSWGAAVGARQERINEIEREIRGRTVEAEPAWDDEGLVETVARVICFARGMPACDCKASCRGQIEGVVSVHGFTARAIVAALREAGALK